MLKSYFKGLGGQGTATSPSIEAERAESCLPFWQRGSEHMTRPAQWDVSPQDFDL